VLPSESGPTAAPSAQIFRASSSASIDSKRSGEFGDTMHHYQRRLVGRLMRTMQSGDVALWRTEPC
jgi:hypothetical protein